MKPRIQSIPGAMPLAGWMLMLVVAGCTTAPSPAPVTERKPAPKALEGPSATKAREVPAAAPRPQPGVPVPATHVVAKSETLFGISKSYGLNFRDVAEWNGLVDPYTIQPGQVLALRVSPTRQAQSAPREPSTAVQTVKLPETLAPVEKPLGETALKREPLAFKRAYSEQARLALDAGPRVPESPEAVVPSTAVETIAWEWPTKGKLVAQFSEDDLTKGIDIAGQIGQPVIAAASGHVDYSGAGLRAYGNLIIIRHNTNFMSVYAHNKELLVKQGDKVERGQKIASMGEAGPGDARLHFEIRQLGRPVDPLTFLPARAHGAP